MSPLPHRPVRRRNRLAIALAISVGIHVLLLPWIARDAVFHVPPHLRRTPVGLIATPRGQVQRGPPSNSPSAGKSAPELQPQLPPALAQEKLTPQKLEGQVVSIGQPQDERPPDKPTKYLSERDSRVLRETRARETSPFFKNALSKAQLEGKQEAQKPKEQAAAPSAVQSGQNGGVRPQRGGNVAKAELPKRERVEARHLPKEADGRVPDRESREGVDGSGSRLAMLDPNRQQQGQPQQGPEGTPGLQRGAPGKRGPLTLTLDRPGEALGPIAGGPMSDDLRGIEEGDETLLNSRSFRFAGFFNRVKETVARIWEPEVLDQSQRRDPTGAIYGWRDRRTLIEYTIDRQGEVKDVKVMVSSGVDYLDRVAVDAFRRAERFPNPPPGLFGPEGTARFGFGFAVTMSRGFHIRMGPAYLPGSPAERGF